MKVQANIPEGRRYFLQVLGRVEFEVDEGEYRRVFETLFKGGDGTFIPNLSFNHGIITGTYKDPAKEDGPWTYEEVSKDGDST